jgi:hypothetical protein
MVPPKTDWLAKETGGIHPLRPEPTMDMAEAPELGGAPPGGAGPGSIVKPMVPPVAPTGKESIAAGMEQHPGLSAKEEGKRQFQELRPPLTADPGSAEYSRQKLAQMEFDKTHGWGGEISAHPGLLGKIGHIAAKVGNIAGDVLAPGVMANIPGTDINKQIQEGDTKRELATRTEAEQEGVTKGLQQEEAKTRGEEAKTKLAKEQNEENLEKDTEGNITGWKDAQGKLHGLDEEGTPQGVKDIAEANQNKPHFEKSTNGDIVQVTPGKGGAPATSTVIHKGDPKVETELTTRTVGGQEHHILVNKGTGEDIKDLGAFKTEVSPAAAMKAEQAGEEPVIGFDKDGIQRIMPRAQAQKEGLTHIVKSSGKDRADSEQNTSALNDMTAKVKNIVQSSQAIDKLGAVQKTLIQVALSGHPDDYKTRFAVSQMEPAAKQYVQDVFSLREASLGLPKQITGGSRVSEPQATALFNTIPGSAGDHAYRLSQLKKFDENLGRLSKKVPRVEGNDLERAFPEEKKGGGGSEAKPPREPKPGMKWQQSKKTGEYREVPENQ